MEPHVLVGGGAKATPARVCLIMTMVHVIDTNTTLAINVVVCIASVPQPSAAETRLVLILAPVLDSVLGYVPVLGLVLSLGLVLGLVLALGFILVVVPSWILVLVLVLVLVLILGLVLVLNLALVLVLVPALVSHR